LTVNVHLAGRVAFSPRREGSLSAIPEKLKQQYHFIKNAFRTLSRIRERVASLSESGESLSKQGV
jgi:hypothetical protein